MEVSQGSVTLEAAGDVGDPEKCLLSKCKSCVEKCDLGKCKSCVTIKLLHRRQTGEGVSHTAGGRQLLQQRQIRPMNLLLSKFSPRLT